MAKTEQMWTYDRFTPGHVFGSVDIELSSDRQNDWSRVFGPSQGPVPRGMMVTAMMEAYIVAIQPRPNGNVHVSQDLAFTDVHLDWGDTVTLTVSCADKEDRKGRYWVRFKVDVRRGNNMIMTGLIRSIWAA